MSSETNFCPIQSSLFVQQWCVYHVFLHLLRSFCTQFISSQRWTLAGSIHELGWAALGWVILRYVVGLTWWVGLDQDSPTPCSGERLLYYVLSSCRWGLRVNLVPDLLWDVVKYHTSPLWVLFLFIMRPEYRRRPDGRCPVNWEHRSSDRDHSPQWWTYNKLWELSVMTLTCQMAYLAADCQLVSDEGRRQLRSVTSRTCVVRRTSSNYGDQVFCSCRSEAVELPSSWTATSWH